MTRIRPLPLKKENVPQIPTRVACSVSGTQVPAKTGSGCGGRSVAVLWFLTPDLWFSRDEFDHI